MSNNSNNNSGNSGSDNNNSNNNDTKTNRRFFEYIDPPNVLAANNIEIPCIIGVTTILPIHRNEIFINNNKNNNREIQLPGGSTLVSEIGDYLEKNDQGDILALYRNGCVIWSSK